MSFEYSLYERKFDNDKGQDHLDFEGVRIIPAFIEFNDAFEGRTYKQKLHIRNVGRSKVLVRLIPPKSLSYKVKRIHGKFLSPGLSIVREVSFTYNHAALSTSILAIHVNEKQCDYHLSANISAASCSIHPDHIDFGLMDACYTSSVRTLTLRNNGSKATRFYVDFTKNENYLIVEPNKGLLYAKSSVSITIRVISSVEGKINIPLWIKCERPFTVPVTGVVIKPKFEPINVSHTPAFALVDFPATYIGVKNVQTVFIRNYSAIASLFCFMGEKDGKFMNLKTCRESDDNFQCFDILPKDGRCTANEVLVLQFIFEPKKYKNSRKMVKPFYFCSFFICRIRCKCLVAAEYGGKVYDDDKDDISDVSAKTPTASASILLEQNSEEYSFIFKPFSLNDALSKASKPEDDCMKFYLHGMAEEPSVKVIPDELTLPEMLKGEQQIRVLKLQNQSHLLPIIISYKKVPYITLEKDTIFLKPLGSIEISVRITPYSLGIVNTQIHFDLLYFDYPKVNDEYKVIGIIVVPVTMGVKSVTKFPPIELNKGITPNYVKEIGKFCQNVTFNTQVEKPKAAMVQPEVMMTKSDALIALPNDTQKSLRPWRSKLECKTIFKRFPRYQPPLDTDYELTAFDKKFKITENDYYMAYTRQKAKKLKLLQGLPEKLAPEYDLNDPNILMCQDIVCRNQISATPSVKMLDLLCIPLTPWQMNNIIISPLVVHTGPIVSHRTYYFEVKIKNENNISISIYVKADKTTITFPDGNRRFIKPANEATFPITYVAPSVGYYTTSLDFIINSCMVYVVTVFADVCTSCLKLSTDVVNFTDDDIHNYLEITNSLNADISFSWLINYQNFLIEPLDGMVKQNSTLMCHVQYLPHKSGPSLADAEFYSGNAKMQEVKFIVNSVSTNLVFAEEELVFTDMPLNIPVVKKAVLMNNQKTLQTFSVLQSPFSEYMNVFPSEGIVYGNSHTIIVITLKFTSCVDFSTTVRFSIAHSDSVALHLRGNVVYPEIAIMPNYMHFKRIPSSSTGVVSVRIQNNSNAIASIKFKMQSYKEYKLSESKYRWASDAEINEFILEKHCLKQLFIHFMPNAVTSETFILPIIINDILGPVDDNPYGNVTRLFMGDRIPDSKRQEIPEHLPSLKIHSYTTEPKLNISKSTVNLACRPSDKVRRAETELKICNPQNETETFCIRTEHLRLPIRVSYPEAKSIIKYEQSFVCSLEPKEVIVLKVTFEPTEFGTYQCLLPLYIKSDYSTAAHNVLVINGIFSRPTITINPTVLYEKPLPLQNTITTLFEFIFKNHYDSCQLITKSEVPKLSLKIVDIIYSEDHVQKVVIKMVHQMEAPGEYHSHITVSCTCKAECKVALIGCVENCFLTNYCIIHMFIGKQHMDQFARTAQSHDVLQKSSLISEAECKRLSIKDTEFDITGFYMEYPFFPSEDASFCKFMNETTQFMEHWIYTQAFYGRCFYKIPEGINYIMFDNVNKYSSARKKSTCAIPYIQLLINLVGNEIEKYFNVENIPSDDMGRALYCTEVYRKAINFIKNQGAYLPYLHPHYLLEYAMYRIYVKNTLQNYPEQESFIDASEHTEFYKLSKQCWLDLLLQTYKIFVYYKLRKPDIGIKLKSVPHEKFQHSIDPKWTNSNIFSNTGMMLLSWVEFHYNDIRKTVWAHNIYLGPRRATHFGQDLEDGFVYSAVTLAYCPYLKDHFENLIENPHTVEEYLHNNIVLSRSWELLNFSMDLCPSNITRTNAVVNCIVLAYLYDVLPNMYPSDTIEFKAGLSCTTTKELEIKNPNEFSVAYKVSFIGNEDHCFQVLNNMHVIKTKGKCKIVITYHAKYIKDIKCTLILNGECKGYHYAKSKVLTLIGKPDVGYATATIQTTLPLNKCQTFDFTIKTPYSGSASYKLHCANVQLKTASEINAVPHLNNLHRFTLARLFPLNDTIEFNDDNSTVINTIIIALTHKTIPTWIYFRNPVAGDFAIKVIVDVKPCLQEELVTVFLPIHQNESTDELSFTNELENIHLDIPCQHNLMWEAIKEYMLCAFKDETHFWKKIRHLPAGMHIIQALMNLTSPSYRINLCQPNTYKISIQGKSKAQMPEYVVIENECSPGFVSIPIKLRSTRHLPRNFSFILTSMNGTVVRRYRTNFIYKPFK